MANNAPNPALILADHLPAHIDELEADLKTAVAKVLEIQTKLVRAKTLLAVAPPEDERLSRITVVADTASAPLEQIVKQLYKLINVVKISELAPADSIERELLLATVKAPPHLRSQVLELTGIFGGEVLNVGSAEVMVSLDGAPAKLDDFEELLRPMGIVAIQRTGRVALPKLDRGSGTAPSASLRVAG